MNALEDDFLLAAEEDAHAVAYILSHLPKDLQEHTDEDTIYYYLDLTAEYYAESGLLNEPADADGYVDINLDLAAEAIYAKAAREDFTRFTLEEIILFLEAYFDYEENFPQ